MNELHILSKKAFEISKEIQGISENLKDIAGTCNAGGVDPFVFATAIFILSCFIGFYIVWKVTPALHTPLMSVTNAISGAVVIAAILPAGAMYSGTHTVLGFIATFFASINIFGGFAVTIRMLNMFQKK